MNSEEIETIFKNNDLNSISNNLTELYSSYKMTNNQEHKKSLKAFLNFIFNYLNSTLKINKSIEFMCSMNKNILHLAVLFPEVTNQFIKTSIENLSRKIFAENIDDFVNDKEEVTKLINFSILIVSLSKGIAQTNQIVTNFILILNTLIIKINLLEDEQINFHNLLLKLFLLGIMVYLSENTNSYNPVVFNQIEQILNFIKDKIDFSDLKNFKFEEEEQILNLLYSSFDKHTKLSANKILSLCFSRILNTLSESIKSFKDDINFNSIYKNIFLIVLEINNKLISKDKIEYGANSNFNKKVHSFIENYENLKAISIKKKNVEINFMKLKKKEIGCLEPDIENAFLGKSFIRTDADNQKIARSIQKKIKSTSKQAIRNLKKESMVIDIQRQKKLQIVDTRRKEDQRLSNQFVEQQNIEYKKLVTSQGKKRFKLKKARGKGRQ